MAVGSSLEKTPAGKGSPLSLPAQPEGPRLGEDQPSAPRGPEDGGLDMVGPRSVSEHPTLKQDSPVTMVRGGGGVGEEKGEMRGREGERRKER